MGSLLIEKNDAFRQITALDVLIEFHGGELEPSAFSQMPSGRLFELIERLTDFYATWSSPGVQAKEIRMSLSDTGLLGPALLYSNSVAIPDPVFDWLTWSIGQVLFDARQRKDGRVHFEEAHRRELGEVVTFLARWKPLVDRGWVIPVPVQAEKFYGFRALLRSRERDPLLFTSWEALLEKREEGDQLTPAEEKILIGGLAHQLALDEAESDEELIRAMKHLAGIERGEIAPAVDLHVQAFGQAAAAQARPLATDAAEWEYYLHRLRAVGQALNKEEKVVLSIAPALAASQLPFISQVTPQVLVDIRTDESAFVEWQLELSSAVRAVEALPVDGSFAEEAGNVLEEWLTPAAEAVRRATSKSVAIRRGTKDSMLRLGLGAAASSAAVVIGAPVEYAASSAGLSALVDLTVKAMLRPSVSGSQAVLARLVREG